MRDMLEYTLHLEVVSLFVKKGEFCSLPVPEVFEEKGVISKPKNC